MLTKTIAISAIAIGTAAAFAPSGRINLGLLQQSSSFGHRTQVAKVGPSLSRGFSEQARSAAGLITLRSAAVPYPTIHPVESETLKVEFVHSSCAAEDYEGEHLVLTVVEPEGDDKEALAQLGVSAAVDAKLDGAVADLIATTEFKGKAGSASTCRLSKGSPYKQLTVAGAGKTGKMDNAVAAKLGKQVATIAKADKKAKSIAVMLPEGTNSTMVSRFTDSFLSSLYTESRFKTGEGKPKPIALAKVELLGCSSDGIDAALSDASKIVRGVTLCKDLVGAPPNYVTPTKLADVAQQIAKETGLECKILEKDECERMGMGSYLGVAKGSTEPPKFIHLTYKPTGETKKKVAIVGKGLTFDSGGYNLKAGPGSMIEMMKFDMGGSAATLGSALSVGLLKPAGVECHWIVASCENMINGEAMRPGDILTASNGKTIEVLNTDAEGRLTLADALVYAEKQGATEIIDIATLTGACIVSLGMDYAGLWANNETMAQSIKDSSAAAGEKLWHMPLCEESYGEMVKSKIADLANIGGKGAGSITAALFLKEFVNKSSWAHLDIAGPVWGDTGATGYGVRTLTDWIVGRGK